MLSALPKVTTITPSQPVIPSADPLPKVARRLNRDRLLSDPSPSAVWNLKKSWASNHPPTIGFPPQVSALAFDRKLNLPCPRPLSFNLPALEANATFAQNIGTSTVDSSPLSSFSRAFSLQEVDSAKEKITRKFSTAPCDDQVSYEMIVNIPSADLCDFMNERFNSPFIPLDWTKSTVVGIPKTGSNSSDPASQRMIILESCLLKFLTLLLNNRVLEWADHANLLPASQNGFRPGHRANDNVFIFKTAVEKAKRLGKPVFAAFIDLTNAFPLVDRPSLWAKLVNMGMSGPLFDWIRAVYDFMSYSVKKGKEHSDSFSSNVGVPQGCPLSPTLFLLFILDLIFTDDPSDILLFDALISHLEHADDLLLFATLARALQEKLNTLAKWARDNGMTVNPMKSAILVFNSGSLPTCTFYLGGTALLIKSKYRYLGFSIKSTPGVPILDSNYLALSSKAASAGVIFFTMRAMIGTLRPRECLSLYYSLVDPHLSFGADFMIDTKANGLKLLQDTQHAFLRRVLCLGDHSIITLLFTETGVWPIKYRRLDLALRYAAYLIQLPHDRLAWKAWVESVNLYGSFGRKHLKLQSGWTHDLSIALPNAVLPVKHEDWSLERIDSMRALVKTEMMKHIRENTSFSRTPSLATRSLVDTASLKRRAYLDVPCGNHRICLTRILCASHDFAVEALRRKKLTGNTSIARVDRVCKLCGVFSGAVEAVHHALFCCKGNLRLLTLRREFFHNMSCVDRNQLPDDADCDAWNGLIRRWADDLSSAIPLARLAWHVSRLFYEHPIVIPDISSLLPVTSVPAILDPASDYSSEEEVMITTESGES